MKYRTSKNVVPGSIRQVAFLLVLVSGWIGAGCAGFGSHRGIILCSSCHENSPEAGRPSLKYAGDPSRICQDCHKYEDGADHHPSYTNSDFFLKTAVVDPDFKLFNGSMECLTCHKIHKDGNYKKGTRNFLVGGPYDDRREICFRCHGVGTYEGINPHNSMLDDNGELNYGTCVICHVEPPQPEKVKSGWGRKWGVRYGVRFRASVAFLCWRCHPPMPGNFLDKHYLRKPSRKMYAEMRQGDAFVPLDYNNRITCSSCHNPHQPGVIIDRKAARGAGEYRRLRARNICVNCHTSKAAMAHR